MSRYARTGVALVFLVGASAAGGAQELSLSAAPHRTAAVALPAFGADCAGGEIYDDGEPENGYSGDIKLVEDFQAVQRFTPAAFPATYDTVCVALVAPGGPNLDFEIEIRDDDGPNEGPGTLLRSLPASASGIPEGFPCAFYSFDISSPELVILSGNVWIGVRWNPSKGDGYPDRFVCVDETPTTPLHTGFVNFNLDSGWQYTHDIFLDYRAKLVRAVPGVVNTAAFFPDAIEVDLTDLTSSNGNGVFEPGEVVEVAPAWTNGRPASHNVSGTASGFTGPAGPEYDLVDDTASYGSIAPDETVSCRDGGTCYRMGIDPDGDARPAQHWHATFDETLSEASAHSWTLHVGDSFDDVSPSNLSYPFIETLLHQGVTSGCSGGDYCPAAGVTRAQMSVFVLKALLGAVYTPAGCNRVFEDVPCASTFARWIEDFAARDITGGCGGGNFCPQAGVTRAQMAVFMLRGLLGPSYTPPTCGGVFDDVPCPSLFANWVEDLAARGITGGCGGGNYCPGAPVSRGQMAVFLTKTFGLTLYGP